MLTITAQQLASFETHAWHHWLDEHTRIMAELLPEVAASYPAESWRQLITGLLRRADAYGMTLQQESIAYCYGCLTLGIGFETRPNYVWTRSALALRGVPRAEALWDGYELQSGSTGLTA